MRLIIRKSFASLPSAPSPKLTLATSYHILSLLVESFLVKYRESFSGILVQQLASKVVNRLTKLFS
jgi:hypothetical protein